MTIRISELYGGPQIREGEGVLTGVTMPFLRVAACNLSCSWCDSKYTWEAGYHYTEHSVDELLAQLDPLLASGVRWVSLTGGEPTIYSELGVLAGKLWHEYGVRVIVETNGLRLPHWFSDPWVFVSCSPKLPASGQDAPRRRGRVRELVAARNHYPHDSQYKFVIADQGDLDALPAYCQDVGIDLSGRTDRPPVYLQPNGYVQPTEKYLATLSWLQANAPAGVRVTCQLHRLLHGPDARGV